jgi:hypothetical protein
MTPLAIATQGLLAGVLAAGTQGFVAGRQQPIENSLISGGGGKNKNRFDPLPEPQQDPRARMMFVCALFVGGGFVR